MTISIFVYESPPKLARSTIPFVYMPRVTVGKTNFFSPINPRTPRYRVIIIHSVGILYAHSGPVARGRAREMPPGRHRL